MGKEFLSKTKSSNTKKRKISKLITLKIKNFCSKISQTVKTSTTKQKKIFAVELSVNRFVPRTYKVLLWGITPIGWVLWYSW